MAKGLKLPIGVNPLGGAAMVEGNDQNQKIIFTAMSDCDNENAFEQDQGISAEVVFSLNDVGVGLIARRKIVHIFQEFYRQNRFKIQEESIKIEKNNKQEMILEFEYIDIETDEVLPFEKTFTTLPGV